MIQAPGVPHGRYAFLAALFAVAATFHVFVAMEAIGSLTTARVRAPFGIADAAGHVAHAQPEAEAVGIRDGDALVRVGERPLSGEAVLWRALATQRRGETLTFTLRRDGKERVVSVTLSPAPRRDTLGDWKLGLILGILTPLICLGVGFWAAVVRPRDPLAWLLLGLMLSLAHFGGLLASRAVLSWPDIVRPMAVVYEALALSAWPIFMLLFGLYFPEPIPWEGRYPWVKWLLIVPLTCAVVLNASRAYAASEDLALLARLAPLPDGQSGFVTALSMTAIGLFFANLGTKGGTTQDRDAKRRLAILNLGAQVAFTPMFLLVVVSLVRTGRIGFEVFPAWLSAFALIMASVFPVTLGYVVIVDRALDVRVIVRQGIQYALARRGVVVLQVLLTLVGAGAALLLVLAPETNRPQKIGAIALAVAFAALLNRFRLRIAAWIDRRFFRDAYDAEQILTELAESVRTMLETEPLLRTVAERISASLHVPRIALLLREGTAFRPVFALGYDAPPALVLEDGGPAARRFQERSGPLFLAAEPLPPPDDEGVRILDSQILLPLSVKDRLLGIMSLGSKKSEEPYSGGDLRLLRSVASQTGLALENSRLTEAVAREVAQRARMSRDIEIAREVQQRLFPQELPAIPGIDYAGACRPALGVGGDYYDFLLSPDRKLGLAIGDVSGKGIPAALLMASLQASLRAQTLDGATDLAALMARINRLVHQASAGAKYATFFYAQFDPASRDLDYVNAGHNPPMLFRDGELVRLTEGGAVVGLMPDFSYQQARLRLQPGDLLVAYTDGVSEAMNPAEEEWGEQRMIQAVRGGSDAAPVRLIEHLMAAADAFASGAKQYDDMTLVVLRVLPPR